MIYRPVRAFLQLFGSTPLAHKTCRFGTLRPFVSVNVDRNIQSVFFVGRCEYGMFCVCGKVFVCINVYVCIMYIQLCMEKYMLCVFSHFMSI